MNQRTKAELLLVLSAFIWGTSFVIVKGALADAAPFPFLALRFVVGGLLMWGAMACGLPERAAVLPCVLLGILLFAGFSFQTWGLVYTTPSKSAFITGFSVIPKSARKNGSGDVDAIFCASRGGRVVGGRYYLHPGAAGYAERGLGR